MKEEVIIERIIGFLIALAASRFEVVPICDGKIKHQAKRATFQRIAKREKARVDGVLMPSRVMKISRSFGIVTVGREALEK